MASKPDPAIIEALKAVTDFDDETVRALAAHGTFINVPARWSLMWEQTPADKAYIILEGEVVIRRNNADVAELGPGSVLGEIALVNHKLRSASVFALTPLKALHFTDTVIADLVRENQAFGDALRTAAEQRLASD
ncbi:cyclic nucleotide-binding domain protein [Aeromicrobium marinum DSM 15272]|uniref:Cyclic nucleotide-binding domain protein n=1 Tax=Aeromicrobium marinum DSM 15272 TaxID=585531 RepID=E2S8L0_9ACTN|nr:cyclic nucleotide-binding domain-containing protein [Aeromicrobium marinum]EFQ84515.1 cyclic nucleotide-binding domain protein [Aeromicrobium marinum DSM 15272]